MREMILAWIFLAGLWGTSESRAATVNCQQLGSELKQMRMAQRELMKSFVAKNISMAETLDRLASDSIAPKQNLHLMLSNSADSFRRHQSREESLVKRFDSKTLALIEDVESCLKRRTSGTAN
jgi:hypothetical protein